MKLTKCFYDLSGKYFQECLSEEKPSLCTKQLNGDSWTTYLAFYNHVDNLCFYYKGIIWQEESEKAINELFASATTSKNLLFVFSFKVSF